MALPPTGESLTLLPFPSTSADPLRVGAGSRVGKAWHPHELRHSGASLMLAQGTPLHVVSAVLGHASIVITNDVYGHLLEGDKRAVAE